MRRRASIFAVLALSSASVFAEEEKEPLKPPKALALLPIAPVIGKEITIQVRGDNLEAATEIRIASESGELKLKPDEAKSGLPSVDKLSPKVAGVTLAKVTTTLPMVWKPGELSVTVTTPGGETTALTTRMFADNALIPEKEPNGGFHDAQPVDLASQQLLTGVINSANDVDVFRIDAKTGESFRIETFANRGGSLIDPYLTIFSSSGQLLMEVDDSDGHRDAIFEITASEDGPIFVVLQDAHRYGSEWHTWTLKIARKEDS
ncbi:MAG: hypothetical protein ACI8UO_003964 [Verrucomicrobiales bacterium]|jgi:hypothetical protein